jgi:hypothetical protein
MPACVGWVEVEVKRDDIPTKTCEQCGKPFLPQYTSMQVACSLRCAARLAKNQRLVKAKAEREQTRAEKERLKTRGRLQAEAQTAFNAYIRLRDAGLPCIDCGQPMEPNKPGGSMDAGHYLARSIAPNLRFHEDNVHGQRKNCNRPGGTTRSAFRAGLVERIGEERVQALETDRTVRKWTQDDFREIRDAYRAKRRELEKERA